ncbi:unnamed protein product [Hapterophycus canaliculatus]
MKEKALALSDTLLRALSGKPFTHDEYPKRMVWHSRKKKTFDGLPPVSIHGFWLLREDVADIFSRHNLGDMKLVEMELYDRDNATKFDDRAFMLVPGGGRKTIDTTVNASGLKKVNSSNPPRYFLPSPNDELKDLRAMDLSEDGVACWVDPDVPYALFLNSVLANDLIAAKLNKPFYLIQI